MRSFLATLSLLSLAVAAPLIKRTSPCKTPSNKAAVTGTGLVWYDSNTSDGTAGQDPANSYQCYSGPATNFPAMSEWVKFDTMWTNAVQYALTPIGDTPEEQNDIYNAILQVSQIAKVDPRVILGVILDESTGNVRVACTNNGVENCGLMQSYNGVSYDDIHKASSITQMIVDGTQGTSSGPGLVQLFNNIETAGNVYEVLREYNSGNINYDNLSDAEGATAAYVSNIANYLKGWNGYGDGPANCDFSDIVTVLVA